MIIPRVQYKPPTKAEIEQMKKEQYQSCFSNPNEFAVWFPKIKDIRNKKILIPESCIIPISFDWFCWLGSDDYKEDQRKEFTSYIKGELAKRDFRTDRELFLKTGLFSNKFVFRNAHLKSGVQDDIGNRYLDIAYLGMCVGCSLSKDLILREFIHTTYERPSIYEGMKLNTEFRVFYSFDRKEVEKIVNYWDYDTMTKNLYEKEDKETFARIGKEIESEYQERAAEVAELCKDILTDIDLSGTWSVDFMWTGKQYALIDMALAKDSYYYEK